MDNRDRNTIWSILGGILVFALIIGVGYALVNNAENSDISSTAGTGGPINPVVQRVDVEAIIQNWPDKPKEVARQMVSLYGQPDEMTPSHIIWINNGPWKRTVVYRDETAHNFPRPHSDVLEQTLSYQVPVDKFDELAMLDGSLIASRTKGELMVLGESEELNYLALNVANDVVSDTRTLEEARDFYGDTARAFYDGQSPEYTQGLQFVLIPDGNVDEDVSVL